MDLKLDPGAIPNEAGTFFGGGGARNAGASAFPAVSHRDRQRGGVRSLCHRGAKRSLCCCFTGGRILHLPHRNPRRTVESCPTLFPRLWHSYMKAIDVFVCSVLTTVFVPSYMRNHMTMAKLYMRTTCYGYECSFHSSKGGFIRCNAMQ